MTLPPTTRERTRWIIAELGFPLDLLSPEARLVEDLGVDSTDRMALEIAIGEEFGIEIESGDWETVGDVYESVELAVSAGVARG